MSQSLSRRSAIFRLEEEILKRPQVQLPIENEFLDGIYARTMFIPQGTVLTGAIHAKDCFTVVRHGEIAIYSTDDLTVFKSGDMIQSKAGIKRAGIAITDTLITGFMANPLGLTDLGELWEFYTVPNDVGLDEVRQAMLEVA